ncbi:MAG: DUF4416 family protein [Spirochaetes bacterium]|nr:DUF4416 family protein [Spirochaetota bacterium]
MSRLKEPPKVKLVIAFFTPFEQLLNEVIDKLINHWGELDYVSSHFPFTETSYYQKEMGTGLILQIVSFKNLIHRNGLPEVKNITCQLESIWQKEQNRQVNIDPGLLTLENFILATGKGYSHRIYLDKGVYADLTLIYQKSSGYQNLPWTYPNYQNQVIKDHLTAIRKIYVSQL